MLECTVSWIGATARLYTIKNHVLIYKKKNIHDQARFFKNKMYLEEEPVNPLKMVLNDTTFVKSDYPTTIT